MKVNHKSPFGIENLPRDLEQHMKKSSITEKEVMEDPETMIELLSSYTGSIYESKIDQQVLTTNDFNVKVEKIFLNNENPSNKYRFENQLGEGGICKVFKAV